MVQKLPDQTWRWCGRDTLAGGSIWHLEAAAKQVPLHEALTNIRLHFQTDQMSAGDGDIPCIEGLEIHWLGEASIELAKAQFDHEALWERRIAAAREAGDRIHFIGNPEDVLHVDTAGFRFTDLGRIRAVNFNKLAN